MMRLPTPRLTVQLDDDRELTVQALNVDMLAWDRTRTAKHWPSGQDAPFLWMTFLAWSALKRTGEIDGMSLPDFETHCLAVTSEDTDDGADPTLPAHGAG